MNTIKISKLLDKTTDLRDEDITIVSSNCASYVIETGRFNSSNGTTHSDNSENDSWYRLYSDGWCEHGRTVTVSKSSSKSINLLQSYSFINYNIYWIYYGGLNVNIGSTIDSENKFTVRNPKDNQKLSWEIKDL